MERRQFAEATAVGKNGEVFSDIGDANPGNCQELIAKHLIRMASTRAKGRALRDMCNIGIACLEELSDFDDVIGNKFAKAKPKPRKHLCRMSKPLRRKMIRFRRNLTRRMKRNQRGKLQQSLNPKPKKKAPKVEPETKDSEDQSDAPKMSQAQKRAVYNLSRRRGISVEELETMAVETYGVELESLSTTDASNFIRTLQQAA